MVKYHPYGPPDPTPERKSWSFYVVVSVMSLAVLVLLEMMLDLF